MAKERWDMLSFDCGTVAIVARQDQLVRLCFECSQAAASLAVRNFHPEAERASQSLVTEGLTQLTEFFHGSRSEFNLSLCKDSLSAFAVRVHRELDRVPIGSVVSYGELAARAGSPGAARAVGSVMSSNPFPLVVPCHRVVNADGNLGKYSAARGVITKAWLIDFESKVEAGLRP
jgi:methylated-DNA-[protein]-cysteine S-methyltransferase